MLQGMRKVAKSWVSSLFLGALALSFGVWGIADVFTASVDTSVATVGGLKIPADVFQREYRNTIRNESIQVGHTITPDEARAAGLGKAILDRVINRTAVDEAVSKYGLTTSDAQVTAQIRGMQAFAGPLGTFDRTVFLERINTAGYAEQEFIDAIRADTTRDQLSKATQNGFQIPPGYARVLFSYLNELRAADYVVVPESAAGNIATPDDATLTAYVKAHAATFSTPEYRQLVYAAITPDDVMNQVTVTDAQLRQEYQLRKATYQVAEKRDLQQIVFPTQAEAQAARAKIDAGTSFADVAAARGQKLTDISLGTITQTDIPDKASGIAAFALPVNGTTQPLKGAFGWVLIHVVNITPGLSKSFDEVKDELKQDLLKQLAAAKVVDMTNAYTDALGTGDTLEQAAKKAGMKVIQIPAVDKKGLGPDGAKTDVPADPDFIAQMFSSEIGQDGDPFPAKDGSAYAIKVIGDTPPKIKPLDQVRVQALAAWMTEQRAKALDAKAKELAAQATSAQSLAGIAGSIGAIVQKSPALHRTQPNGIFTQAMISKLFSSAPGKAVYGPLAKGDGYVIATVTGVVHPDQPVNNPQYEQGKAELSNEVGGDINSSFALAARAQSGVTINNDQVQKAIGE